MKILKLRESFEICGLKACTNNADEMSGRGVIANLWGEFLKFNASGSSAEKNEIYAAYYDYENGAQGEYSVLIGTCSKEGHHKESHDEACKSAKQCCKNERDETCDKLRIEAGDYAVFDFANEPTRAGESGPEFGNFLKAQNFKEPLKRTLKSSLEDKI
ncbi:GyrI-like domain-containing protein [uncultured Campylobacter sp.]|uniref:GyrI-like domain-containing protein n=1 Tax=uncultured Campylobacter sp. TaxID=218934 RepID=UPI0028E64C28|nr:GyrI-like domain-containing protein [uncultured Campylobacter sp.]